MKKKETILLAAAVVAGTVAFIVARGKKKSDKNKELKHYKKSRHASRIFENLRKEQSVS